MVNGYRRAPLRGLSSGFLIVLFAMATGDLFADDAVSPLTSNSQPWAQPRDLGSDSLLAEVSPLARSESYGTRSDQSPTRDRGAAFRKCLRQCLLPVTLDSGRSRAVVGQFGGVRGLRGLEGAAGFRHERPIRRTSVCESRDSPLGPSGNRTSSRNLGQLHG